VVRRTVLALGIALGAIALSSCSSADHPNAVATVDDAALTQDDLEQLLNNKVVQEALGIGQPTNGVANLATQADAVISVWVVLEAIAAQGAASLDDEAPASSVLATAGTDFEQSFAAATGPTRDLITRYIAFQTQNQAGTLDSDAMRTAVHSADVHVDSRYGYWDEAKASVLPFGDAAATPTT